jgi:hypothetical protein
VGSAAQPRFPQKSSVLFNSRSLVDVCRFYDPTRFPHQTRALEWLQRNIPSATLTTFARLWRDPNASAN